MLFSITAVPFCIPTNSVYGYQFCCLLTSTWPYIYINNSCPNRFEVISHQGFEICFLEVRSYWSASIKFYLHK